MWFTQLVLVARLPMRAATRVMVMISQMLGRDDKVPHWTTGRRWLQRQGLAQLTMPLVEATNWIWLIDHSVQIGQEKCLVILGIRQSELPEAGTSLQYEDMDLVDLVLRKSWTKSDVDTALEAAVARTGVPRAILSDHGGDVAGGISLFQQRHPATDDIYDFKHKAACLLKQRLEKNPRWKQFQTKLNCTRNKIQQTELGFLIPTAQKVKARFMNLEKQLKWAAGILDLFEKPGRRAALKNVQLGRLRKKLGWVNGFRQEVREWAEWQHIINQMGTFVNQQMLYFGAAVDLKVDLPLCQHASSQQLMHELLAFVEEESHNAKIDERLPGSTEVLESCFGRFKVLEREQSKGGFTSLLAAFGTMVMDVTKKTVTTAMQHSTTQSMIAWCKDKIPTRFASLRRLALKKSATETG
jgi:hypothetical protein